MKVVRISTGLAVFGTTQVAITSIVIAAGHVDLAVSKLFSDGEEEAAPERTHQI